MTSRTPELDQPPRQQKAVAILVAAVAVAQRVGLVGQVERAAGLARQQHAKGLFAKLFQSRRPARLPTAFLGRAVVLFQEL